MRFGDYLLQQQFTPWATEYLQYDRVKKVIRETHDETIITQWLDTEFVKIKDFLTRQISTIQHQLQLIEHQKAQPALIISSPDQLGDDLVYPLFDLHDLVRYLDLCLTGFKKLAKSYTKRYPLQTTSSSAMRRHDAIIKALDHYYTPLNQLLVNMAHIKRKRSREIQKRNSHMKGLPSIPLTPSLRSRDLDAPLPPLPLQNDDGDRVIISSYWIHPHHVFELKTLLLIYATLNHHHPLSTIYLDNSRWDVYNSHMNEQTLPTDSIECTWPGFYLAHSGNIHVNHIAHQESDVISIRRHTLPWASFQSYLRTSHQSSGKDKGACIQVSNGNEASTSDGDLANATALVVEPKSRINADEQQLDQALRDRIQQQEWQPVGTWTCERTTFTPTAGNDNNTIKIHIDTNIVIKELDGSFGGGQQQSGGIRHRHTGLSMMTVVQQSKNPDDTKKIRWRQHDDNSLGRKAPADILTSQPPAPKQQERPEWLKRLVDGCNWIHAVPRFSMYVHLVSQLYGDHVPLLPWWLGYFDRSWLDSAIGQNDASYGLSRSVGLQPLLHGAPVSSLLTHPIGNDNVVVEATRRHHMSVDMGIGGNEEEGDDDDDLDDGTGKERDIKLLLPKSATPNIVPATTRSTPSISVPAMTTSAKTAINNMVKKTTKRMAKSKWTTTTTTTTATTATTATTSTRAMTKLKMKVEPKVFFANERTFLSWLQFCALLLTVSLNMINFGSQDDKISRICGGMFIIVTILMALYALAKYEFRAWNLLTRSTRYRFDDVYGPAILCLLLVVAMLINFGLRLNSPPPPGRQSASE